MTRSTNTHSYNAQGGIHRALHKPTGLVCCLDLLGIAGASPDPLGTSHLPRGMMERYLPLNLLAIVISCHNVHPRLEKTWWAAAGGWWLTWKREERAREVPATLSVRPWG